MGYQNLLNLSAIEEISPNSCDFTVLGDGPLYEQVFFSLGKFPNVNFDKRFLTPRELKSCFDQHHILYCPTQWDSQGLLALEALAAGLFVYSTHSTSVPEFLDDISNCFLTKYEDVQTDVEHFVQKRFLKNFKNNARLAHANVRKKFGISKIAAQELELKS